MAGDGVHARAAQRIRSAGPPGEPRRERLLLAEPQRRVQVPEIYRARAGAPLREGVVQRPLPSGAGLPGLHHVSLHSQGTGTLPQPRLLRLRPDQRHARRHQPGRPPAEPPHPRQQKRLRDLHRRPPERRGGPRGRHHHLHRRQPRGGRLQPRRHHGRPGRALQGLRALRRRRLPRARRRLRALHGRGRGQDPRGHPRRLQEMVVHVRRTRVGHAQGDAHRVRPVHARAPRPGRRRGRARGEEARGDRLRPRRRVRDLQRGGHGGIRLRGARQPGTGRPHLR
mmetsp:Transcript_26203/g.52225  ORF Transcript_26203/g.52225 Transcript_26203/m.52225 type:complete len:282 (+) Transcript_26203:691-1536(+)